MLAPLAIVGGAVAAYHVFGRVPNGRPIVPSAEHEFTDKLETEEERFMHDSREWGTLAPTHLFEATRLPFRADQMPYYVHTPGDSHMDSPVTRVYQQLCNFFSHDREDFVRAFAAHRPQMARKAGVPAYSGFTNEMTLFGDDGQRHTTQHMLWSWLPAQPSDSDYNDVAGLMSKAAPPDPLLFTPQSHFAAAPGVGFRYSST